MTKCYNCQSPDLVIIGGAVLAGTELFCDVVQCVSCCALFATITRQVVIKLVDERETVDEYTDPEYFIDYSKHEGNPALREEVDND